MKTLLYILIFSNSAIGFAQDPQLFENTWYLQKLIIDGEELEAPDNEEVAFVQLNINAEFFDTIICEGLSGHQLTITNTEIDVIEFIVLLDEPCDLAVNNDYEDFYYNGFFEWQFNNKNFSYQIVDDGNFLLMVWTNENGDKAIYGNQLLSNEDFNVSRFSIHPNPTKDKLFLSSKDQNKTLSIKIFNIEGKLLNTESIYFNNETSIDVSQLNSGIYFLNIAAANGRVEVHKFVKE